MSANHFILGELYAHRTIMEELKVGNSGGVRVSKNSRGEVGRVVLFSTSEQESNPQENPYLDRSEGAVLTYTGTGRIGNQNLTGPPPCPNRRHRPRGKYPDFQPEEPLAMMAPAVFRQIPPCPPGTMS